MRSRIGTGHSWSWGRSWAAAQIPLAGLLALAGASVGCGPVTPTHIIGTGLDAPSGAVPTAPILIGGALDAGQVGYILTANVGSYRVTWAGDGYIFRGSVFAEPGTLSKVFAGCTDGTCALAPQEDVVRIDGSDPDRIDFWSDPLSGKRSGFDLQLVGGTGTLIIDLLVNDYRSPNQVHFTSVVNNTPRSVVATTLPLALQPIARALTGGPITEAGKTVPPPPAARDMDAVKTPLIQRTTVTP